MAKAIPDELTNVMDGTEQSLGSGILRNAAIRRSRSTFDTSAVDTTTADTLSLGKFRSGISIRAFDIAAGSNMSAASIAVGTADDPDKYLAAGALPNATAERRIVMPGAEGYAPLGAEEELIVTISGATIPNGDLMIDVEYSQR